MIGVVILAAGSGSRLGSLTPKPLVPLLGTPMVCHIIANVPDNIPTYLIVNPDDLSLFKQACPKATLLTQSSPKGTGHALIENKASLQHLSHLIIVNADTPLIPKSTFLELASDKNDNVLIAFECLTKNAYGQLRIDNNCVTGIIEAKEREQHSLHFSNFYYSGVMKLSQHYLNVLCGIKASPLTREYYLTSLATPETPFSLIIKEKERFDGANTLSELIDIESRLKTIQIAALLKKGVHLDDYQSISICPQSNIGKNCKIGAQVSIKDNCDIGENCTIGQGSILSNTQLARGVTILPYSILANAQIGTNATIGPFAHIQEGSTIGDRSQIGNFVEVKRSTIATGVKAKHLCYLGDSYIDNHANIGAGVITCNYVPWKKNKALTYIGTHAFIGSNCQLIAPAFIGDFSVCAAGSTITRDVPPYALAISRGTLKLIPSWARSKIKVKPLAACE
ncbi:MAG: NTP transferase domain-containing protein [Pseudomonadota bacterium]|nr:NTP transferase domain-containing protein [Pseudomonadota bacterium]